MADRCVVLPGDSLQQFDEVHIISDLHLGGTTGFQIFDSDAELAALISHLQAAPAGRRVALVINGDFVDFLAEEPAAHFDPANAVSKFRRIVGDGAFRQTWAQLQTFTATADRSLVVNLGNHDLELALPWVRTALLNALCGDNAVARGRVTLAFDGTGFLCRVGNARLLCVHGNEVDDWNLADYERLRRIGRDIQQGRCVDNWIPNAGSQLVIDVMNDIKKHFPFVDVLKPEKQAVVPTLAALAPDQRDKLNAIAATVGRLTWDKIRRATGFLGDEVQVDETGSGDGQPAPWRSKELRRPGDDEFGGQRHLDALLETTEERLLRDVPPAALVTRDQESEYLGLTSAVLKYFGNADTAEVLREALQGLSADRSFEPLDPDQTYKDLDEYLGDCADFVVAGHTHLARALKRQKGSGWYFNSGTWARLIRLEPDVLRDQDSFKTVFEAFRAGTMKALDETPDLVLRHRTVVSIWADGATTCAELRRVELVDGNLQLPPVPQTRFTKT